MNNVYLFLIGVAIGTIAASLLAGPIVEYLHNRHHKGGG